MKSLLLKASLIIMVIGGYLASPFVTAWSIREAVRNGNTAYLERAIDWPSVRETLKPTLGQIALSLPDPEQQPVTSSGLWQRFKAYVGQSALDKVVDSYITPEGLPQLFAWRKTYRENVSHEPDEAKLYGIQERIARAWDRVKRAEFTSLTNFEMDMADKHDPNRIYLGKLELTGLGWKLKELRVKFLTSAQDAVSRFAGTGNGSFFTRAEAAARLNR